MYKHITKEYIKTHKFDNDGLVINIKKENVDYDFAPGTVLPQRQEDKTIQLRIKIRDLIIEKFDRNYAKIESKCGLHRDTLMKFITNKSKGQRGLSRGALSKFCVGAELSLEETQELFILQGFALDPVNNLLDAIVVNCIQCKEDIYKFLDMCEEKGIQIDKKTQYM